MDSGQRGNRATNPGYSGVPVKTIGRNGSEPTAAYRNKRRSPRSEDHPETASRKLSVVDKIAALHVARKLSGNEPSEKVRIFNLIITHT